MGRIHTKWSTKYKWVIPVETAHTQLIELSQVKSKVPWLADVLKLLQEAQELSQDLIDKVTIAIDWANVT